jgi:hypothetical protein
MDADTKAFFAAEVKGANALCFDCGQKDPQWASCTNGIYICLECSGRHRSIGVHLSYVRCIWMDKWKPHELAMMKYGGNQRLADYLDEHGPKDWRKLQITQKYDTKPSIAYRQLLKAEINSGAPPPEKKTPRASAPAPQKKASMFDLFDLVESAENVVDSLMTPSANKKQAGYAVEKPVRSAEKQKQLDLAAAELKRLQAEAPASVAAATPCAVEVAKPDTTKKAPAIDIWGDDMWD